MEHTKEGWKYDEVKGRTYISPVDETNNDGSIIALLYGPQRKENASRIVACVNACEGIGIALLEQGGGIWKKSIEKAEAVDAEFKAIMKENARLREVLNLIAEGANDAQDIATAAIKENYVSAS